MLIISILLKIFCNGQLCGVLFRAVLKNLILSQKVYKANYEYATKYGTNR